MKFVVTFYLTLMVLLWVGSSDGEQVSCPCKSCTNSLAHCAAERKEKVPGPFAKDITNIQMQNNNIRRITAKSFGELPQLEVLRLDKNKIDEVWPGVFSGMPKLNDLNLQKNNIMVLPDDLVHPDAPLAYGIKLNDNKLSSFPMLLLKKTRKFINVVGNPINCNCYSVIPDDLKNKVIGFCAWPPELKHRAISSITYKDVNCSSCEGYNCNHGSCYSYTFNGVEKRQCLCEFGYTGKRCSTKYDPILPTEEPQPKTSTTTTTTETSTTFTTPETKTTRKIKETKSTTESKSTTDPNVKSTTTTTTSSASSTTEAGPSSTKTTAKQTTTKKAKKTTNRKGTTRPSSKSSQPPTTTSRPPATQSPSTSSKPTKFKSTKKTKEKTSTRSPTITKEAIESTKEATESTSGKTTKALKKTTPPLSTSTENSSTNNKNTPTISQSPATTSTTTPTTTTTTPTTTTTDDEKITVKPTKTNIVTLTKTLQKCRKLLREAIKRPVSMLLHPDDDYEKVTNVVQKFINLSNLKKPEENPYYDPVQLCVINLLVQLVKNED